VWGIRVNNIKNIRIMEILLSQDPLRSNKSSFLFCVNHIAEISNRDAM